MSQNVTPKELADIFGGSGFMPMEAAGLILTWDNLADKDRRERFGSSDFLDALRIMARTHPVKDSVDQMAERVAESLSHMLPFAGSGQGMFVGLDVLQDVKTILRRYEEMRLTLHEHRQRC